MAQLLIVAVLVAGCSIYAAWTLMPASWRRAVALELLRLPLPSRLAVALAQRTTPASGCACDGCDRAAAPAKTRSDGATPIKFHARPPR